MCAQALCCLINGFCAIIPTIMATITTADFKKGTFVVFKNEPHQIVEFQHVNPGKGSAFVRTKLKSLTSGKVQEFTYKSGESVEELPVETHEMQYLYPEGDGFVFMDNFSYDQVTVPSGLLGDFVKYLKPNDTYQVLVHEDEAVGIRLPRCGSWSLKPIVGERVATPYPEPLKL